MFEHQLDPGGHQMTIAMANAREFRANARFCDELSKAARAGPDCDSWLQMKVRWLARAADEGRAGSYDP